MRRVLLIGLLFLCCCKNKDTTTTPTGAVDEKFSFSAQYDSVLSVYPNSDYNFSFYIRVNSGNISKNILTCSISGLPAGVTVTPVSQEVGVLLGGVFTFKVANVAVGNYPIKFEINGKQGSEMHNLILQVKPLPDRNDHQLYFSSNSSGGYALPIKDQQSKESRNIVRCERMDLRRCHNSTANSRWTYCVGPRHI
jgi:hypothetical protein